ncbi:hypothetical protein BCR42DRAFT_423939 [Absidia repens]|uniref:Uncharacterized protein n=1 Tax=Absidia repens TaxID=90262 RepID=A0A1X2I4F7_9FUNG|nr:hypothetical protein BCR42DRAFT_423939 [Absidia repens]
MVLSMPILVYQVLFGVHRDKKMILYRKIKKKVDIEAKTCCIDFFLKELTLVFRKLATILYTFV